MTTPTEQPLAARWATAAVELVDEFRLLAKLPGCSPVIVDGVDRLEVRLEAVREIADHLDELDLLDDDVWQAAAIAVAVDEIQKTRS